MPDPRGPRLTGLWSRGRATALAGQLLPAILLALPVAVIILRLVTALAGGNAMSPGEGPAYLSDRGTLLLEQGATSLLVWFLATTVSLVLGTGLAWLIVMYRFPLRGLAAFLLVMPMAIPPYLAAYTQSGFLDLGGMPSRIAMGLGAPGGIHVILQGPLVLGLNLGFQLFPYVYLMVVPALRKGLAGPLAAAMVLGRRGSGLLLNPGLPLLRPFAVAGAALAGMEAMNEYAAAAHFGVPTLTMALYRAWAHAFDLDAAMAIGASLTLFTLGIMGLEHAMRGRSRYQAGPGAAMPAPEPAQLRGARLAAALGLVVLVLTPGLLVPLAQLLWWLAIFPQQQADAVWNALVGTLVTSGSVSLISIVAAGAAILAVNTFGPRRGPTGLLRVTAHASYGIPGIVMALGVMLAGSSLSWLIVQGGMALLLYALSIRFFSVAHSGLESAWKHRVAAYHEAAVLGSLSWRTRTAAVYLPLLRPAAAGALILLILDLSKELSATLLLRPIGFNTLATLIYEQASQEYPQQAALPALIMILMTGGLCALVFRRHTWQNS